MPESTVTLRRVFTHKAPRLMFALILALGMTVLASVATQQTANAAVRPAATVGLAHRCETIGTLSNGNQATVCTDINTAAVAGGFEIWGTGEYFCGGPSEQCKGIHANNTLTGFGTGVSNTTFQCSTTACPNGGRAMVSTPHLFLAQGLCTVLTGTVTTAAAVLVNGTSTAFHPAANFSTSGQACAI